MPEGGTKTKVTDEEILALFDRRGELNLPVFTAGKMAEILSQDIEDSTISAERIRQRLQKIDEISSYKLGERTVVYAKDGDPLRLTTGQLPLGSVPAVVISAIFYSLFAYFFLGVVGQVAAAIMLLFFVTYAGSYYLTGYLTEHFPGLEKPLGEWVREVAP